MSSSLFDVKEHVIEAQHIREYPRATAHSQEEVLALHVKQYIPKCNREPRPGDVTIIGSPANGFPKELYEALWDELLARCARHGFGIRSIWIADYAWQGMSGVLNERRLGNDPSWLDGARDILHMTNHFRASMPRPLVGVGHSFGGAIMVNLALMHPRLLETLVLIDPVIGHFRTIQPDAGQGPMVLSARRRDLWPSREAAAATFARSPYYRAWDRRVLDAWITHGLRDTPTALYPTSASPPPGSVTLTTTKYQEVFTYLRPRAQALDSNGRRTVLDPERIRDIFPEQLVEMPRWAFYQPESARTFDRLPSLSPSVLWILGGKSEISANPRTRRERMETTGVGIGGSGGAAKGRVVEHVVEECGHLVPMESPQACADQAAPWIARAMERWRAEEDELKHWWQRPEVEKFAFDDEWKALLSAAPKKAKL